MELVILLVGILIGAAGMLLYAALRHNLRNPKMSFPASMRVVIQGGGGPGPEEPGP